jgi:NAD(P)-dependent dehydrogenase (short-subunit alcohol dehydrogenase family)
VRKAIEILAFGGFLTAREAARRMIPHGRGAILLTGASASLKGYPRSAAFAGGKFALPSAPSTCRAIFGNGPTGSIAAICPMGWTATLFGAPSSAPLSLTISSRQAPCQAVPIASDGFPLRLCNLL